MLCEAISLDDAKYPLSLQTVLRSVSAFPFCDGESSEPDELYVSLSRVSLLAFDRLVPHEPAGSGKTQFREEC